MQTSFGVGAPVVAALLHAALEWLGGTDVRRLRSTLLRALSDLD